MIEAYYESSTKTRNGWDMITRYDKYPIDRMKHEVKYMRQSGLMRVS